MFLQIFLLKTGFANFFWKIERKRFVRKKLAKIDVFVKNGRFCKKLWQKLTFFVKILAKLTLGQKLKFHEIYLQKWSCLRKLEVLAKKSAKNDIFVKNVGKNGQFLLKILRKIECFFKWFFWRNFLFLQKFLSKLMFLQNIYVYNRVLPNFLE